MILFHRLLPMSSSVRFFRSRATAPSGDFNKILKSRFTMRFSTFAALAASVLLSQCNAFNPITSTSRKTTVVQDTLRSTWTMMPDDPTPEVSLHFHVSNHFCSFRLTSVVFDDNDALFRLIHVVRTQMSNRQLLLLECQSLTPTKGRWTF